MATGQISRGYALSSAKQATVRPARGIKRKEMKLSLKQRIRNWLNDGEEDTYASIPVEADRLQSDGMRFQLYKAAGGYVIETRSYDRRKDENYNKMYVITEEKDLGEELGKIITMESLR